VSRRSFFGFWPTLLAGAGFGAAKAKPLGDGEKPLAIVVTFDKNMHCPSDDGIENIKSYIAKEIGANCPPVIVCLPGMDVRLISESGRLESSLLEQQIRANELLARSLESCVTPKEARRTRS